MLGIHRAQQHTLCSLWDIEDKLDKFSFGLVKVIAGREGKRILGSIYFAVYLVVPQPKTSMSPPKGLLLLDMMESIFFLGKCYLLNIHLFWQFCPMPYPPLLSHMPNALSHRAKKSAVVAQY